MITPKSMITGRVGEDGRVTGVGAVGPVRAVAAVGARGSGRVDREGVERLRGDLAGFTVDAVQDLLGPVAHAALGREQPVPARLAVTEGPAAGEPLAVLLAAFVLGLPVTRAALDAALPAVGTDGAVRLGLVETSGHGGYDAVRALVDLRPYAAVDALGQHDWWVVSDLAELATGAPLRVDHVLGVGGASVTLARCTIRRHVGRVLDLGTGCGVQALHATRHARHVVATDVSGRALALAGLTLALNGVGDRVELRAGDLLEPVAGEHFDLVVSNPPFVITPRRTGVPAYEYRDAGLVGDELVRQLVSDVGAVLAPGGIAQFLGNWEHRRGEPWSERVTGWLADSGLDGWVVQREVQDPAEYAELWIRDGGRPDAARYEQLYRAWLEDFATRGVEAVGFGLVTLRRPLEAGPGPRPPLRRVEEVRGGGDGPLGEHLAAALDAADLLARTSDAELLERRPRLAADVTEERYHRPGEEDPEVVLLRQTAGFGRVVRADTALAGFAGAADGELTAGQLAGALAHLLERPVADVVPGLLPAVRGLTTDGFLTWA